MIKYAVRNIRTQRYYARGHSCKSLTLGQAKLYSRENDAIYRKDILSRRGWRHEVISVRVKLEVINVGGH